MPEQADPCHLLIEENPIKAKTVRTRHTLNSSSKRNISSWSSRFSPLYSVLPHPSILYISTLYQLLRGETHVSNLLSLSLPPSLPPSSAPALPPSLPLSLPPSLLNGRAAVLGASTRWASDRRAAALEAGAWGCARGSCGGTQGQRGGRGVAERRTARERRPRWRLGLVRSRRAARERQLADDGSGQVGPHGGGSSQVAPQDGGSGQKGPPRRRI